MAGALALGLGFVLLLLWDLLSIKHDLEAGREALDEITLEAASTKGVTGLADQAAGSLQRAADRSHGSLPLRALSLIPGVDDQIRGVRRMADATAALGQAGREAAARIDAQLAEAGSGPGRVALVETALDELDRLEATLAGIDLGHPTGLVPPLREAHRDLVEAISDARGKLDDGRELIEPVRQMLVGPTTFLLLAANNAEMAGGGGLTLSAGGLTIEGGEIELGEVIRAGDLRLPASVGVPDELRTIYRPVGLGIDMRSTTRSPDLTATGPVAQEIMAAHGADIDGVIVVDAIALRDLMSVTGPVEVEGTEITVDNVLAEVLHENYKDFEGQDRYERVAYQGDIAKAVFDAVTTREVAAIDLASALLQASEGRHLLLWSDDPAQQEVWEELGVAGSLHPQGLMVSFQNYGANKVDWYLRPESRLDVGLLPSGDFRARLVMSVDVPAEADMEGASPYILGPTPATHGIFLTVHLPEEARDITTPDPGGFRTAGEEPPMQVRTFLADVPLGSTFERSIEFTLPRSVGALVLLPSARIDPMPLTVDGEVTVDDDEPVVISWLAAVPPTEEAGVSGWVRAPVVGGALATLLATATMAVSLIRARRRRAAPVVPSAASWMAVVALGCFVVAAAMALVIVSTGPRV